METIPENTIYKERAIVIGKLKSNPIFLLKHLPAFSSLVWQQLKMRFEIKWYGQHKARKKFPRWLKKLDSAGQSQNGSLAQVLALIPYREIKNTSQTMLDSSDTLLTGQEDVETYLAKHRWGKLITLLPESLPDHINAWMQTPPPKQDIAWETYSTCERICNLITWISFLSIEQRKTLPDSIYDFLKDSMHWVASHLEFYGKKTGNHLLNNARALILCGILLQNDAAKKMGITIVNRMLPILIQPDGFLRERSTHYQLIILLWLLDIAFFASKDNFFSQADLEHLHETINKMCGKGALFCNKQGILEHYLGDISPDASPIETSVRLNICYPAMWPSRNHITVEESDWHSLICDDNKVLLFCPTGAYPERYSSHAHGDLLSFVWHFEDQPILIDTGRARYTKDPIATLQKSALGHNVVLVNALAPLCESLVVNGHWWPLPYAKAHIEVEKKRYSVQLTHDGFKRATPVKEHSRVIKIAEKGIHITDAFTGNGKALITLIWHLHPIFDCFDQENLRIQSKLYTLALAFNKTPMKLSFLTEENNMGWHSTRYGYIAKHPVLYMQYEVTLPFTSEIEFRITPCAG